MSAARRSWVPRPLRARPGCRRGGPGLGGPAGADACPVCGTACSGRFCEACGHDLTSPAPAAVSAALGSAIPPEGAAPEPTVPFPPPARAGAQGHQGTWTAVVRADRAYFEQVRAKDGPDAEDIEFPASCPERRITLAGPTARIGRRSVSRNVTPEIDLGGPPLDPGVSRLHALLVARPDAGWSVVDSGSANGTTVNDDDEPIEEGVPVPLAHGDRVHVGAWTTIELRLS